MIKDPTRALHCDCGRYRVYWGDGVDGYVIWDCVLGTQIAQTDDANSVFARLYILNTRHHVASQVTQVIQGVSHDGIYHPVAASPKNPYE